jgi:hypothetical protein
VDVQTDGELAGGDRADAADVIEELDIEPLQLDRGPDSTVEPAELGTH